MSIAISSVPEVGALPASIAVHRTARALHRLGAVREREGVSRRTVARRLNTTIAEVKRQEDETTDIPLSALYGWQEALQVPMSELLVDQGEPLASPIRDRAKMLRIMKTAVTILERSRQPSIQRTAQMLVEQLTELMPELEGVSPWPAVGKSRLPSEYGQAIHRRLPDEVFAFDETE